MQTAYPLSQFEPDTDYVFENSVTYTLTPIDEVDDPTTRTATADTSWSYHDPKWVEPTGHFNVFKWGNDDGSPGAASWTSHYDSWGSARARSDTGASNGWYGMYRRALNQLRDGEDVQIAYTAQTVGYLLPWTWEGDTRIADNYGKRPVTMTTTDTGLRLQGGYAFAEGPEADFDFTGLGFVKPELWKIKAINVNPDGSFSAKYAGDGTFEYQRDYDDSHQPTIVMELEIGGEWVEWARVDYKTGSFNAQLSDAAQAAGATASAATAIVSIPEQAANWRTRVTSEKDNAAINYYVRPVVQVHATGQLRDYIADRFDLTNTPEAYVYNSVEMQATDYDGAQLVDLSKNGHDRLYGYTTDVYAVPSKAGTAGDPDYNTGLITLSYTAAVEERSVISDLAVYRQALADGDIAPEESCTWYDLLPAGVTPLLDTVRLRSGDAVTDKYVVPNWRNTGRALLVVEADLTPQPRQYAQNGITYYEDRPAISFDAVYNITSLFDHGSVTTTADNTELWSVTHHNVIAFESGNDSVGTIDHYKGEANDPYGSANRATSAAFADDAEREALAGLDGNRATESFLYAGATTTARVLTAANTSLDKAVSVNDDGVYSSGLGADRRDVYEGGRYRYQVRAMSDSTTRTSGMVFYDSLDNYAAIDGNQDDDLGAGTWKGTFVGVDTSGLEAKGAAPVVYYSTIPDLQVQDREGAAQGQLVNGLDATTDGGQPVWVEASAFLSAGGSPAAVKAVAVDCTKRADGTDFTLEPLEAAVFYINMAAPQGADAAAYIEQKAHAYNNVFLDCVSADASTDVAGARHLIRKDYVKVGLVEHNVAAKKVWDDDSDRDGLRPGSVTLALYHNGAFWQPSSTAGFENFENPVTLTAADADENGAWTHLFEHVPYCTDDGVPIRWTVREVSAGDPTVVSAPDGYAVTTDAAADGTVTVTNTHVPEKVEVAGAKTWALADEALAAREQAARPASIRVSLYADGALAQTKTVRADSDGNWAYSFSGLNRYRDQGAEIAYTVEEQAVPAGSLDSYAAAITATDGGFDIENTYHPYGDAMFSKAFVNATAAVAGSSFEFALTVTGADGEPIFDELAYTVADSQGGAVGSGTIATGGTFRLADGQSIRIADVPEGAQVTAVEAARDGWTSSGGDERTVTVKPNETVSAAFTNAYRTSTTLNLQATKDLDGRALQNNQFKYYLYNGSGTALKYASNRVDGSVTFGAITYGNADDGKTYTYTMREVDRVRDGYANDTTVYQVDVAVSDNGDGTMTATPTYYKVTDGTTDPVTRVALDGGELPAFKNTYRAEGQVTLRAWKELTGGDIADWDGQFKFDLLAPVEGKDFDPADATTYTVVQGTGADASDSEAAANQPAAADAHGEATFLPLRYDQYDAGKTFTYFIREVDSNNAKVTYSTEVFGYTVTVTDNGDGTLSCAYAALAEDADDAVPTIGGKAVADGKAKAGTPVFTNELNPGTLRVTKAVENPDGAPDATFKFRVELSNDEGNEVDLDLSNAIAYARGTDPSAMRMSIGDRTDYSLGDGNRASAMSNQSCPQDSFDPLSALASLFAPEQAYAAEGDDDLEGEAYAIFDADARALVFFRDEAGKYTNEETYTVTTHGDTYNGPVYTGVETSSSATWPTNGWRIHGWSRAIFLDKIRPISTSRWFYWTNTLVVFEGLENFDTSEVEDMSYMFSFSSAARGFDFSILNTSNVKSMDHMFYHSGGSYDLSGFDTRNVQDFNAMFAGSTSSSFNTLDLSSFNVSSSANIRNMFYGCSNLKTIYVSEGFDVQEPKSTSVFGVDSGKALRLVGGAGTRWNADHITDDYAHIDGGPSDPGYFTDIADSYCNITYNSNDGSSNTYTSSDFKAHASTAAAPSSTFTRNGYRIAGWSDTEGGEVLYAAGATIPANTYAAGTTTDLYAVWEPLGSAKKISEGVYEVTMFGDMTVDLGEVPAGTAYRVYEETPAGWVLVSQENAGGTIASTEVSEAVFTNKYQPSATSASLRATKTLDGAPASGFTFQLLDAQGEQVATATASGGMVQFDPISYVGDDAVGTYEYAIREVAGGDSRITYDAHAEAVTVTVEKDAGGNLTASAAYDDDGASFANYTNPGSLRLTKQVTGTDAADKDFTFQVQLRDSKGRLATDAVEYYILDADGNVVDPSMRMRMSNRSRTENSFEATATADSAAGMSFQSWTDYSFFAPEKAYAAEGDDDLAGEAYAIYDTDSKTLFFFRSEGTYTSGENYTVTTHGNTYSGPVYGGFEASNVGEYGYEEGRQRPWHVHETDCKKAVFLDRVKLEHTAEYFFYQMEELTEIEGLEKLDTSDVESMEVMFALSSQLQRLDVSTFDTSKVTNMSGVFEFCEALEYLDVSNWNTSNVTAFDGMFESIAVETLDLSSFSVSGSANIIAMFRDCHALTTIYVSEGFDKAEYADSRYAFVRCTNLVGGAGTVFNESHIDGSYAHIDGGESYPGYFTALQRETVVYHANDGTDNTTKDYCEEGGTVVVAAGPARPGYIFLGWNTKADGSGRSYRAGVKVAPRGTLDLYAQWRSETAVSYKVNHYQQNVVDGAPADAYTLATTDTLWAEPGSEVTPAAKSYDGFTAPAVQTATVKSPNGTTVVDYRYDRQTSLVHFDGNGATGGQMADELFVPGFSRALSANAYSKEGYVFAGWNTDAGGSGAAYADGQSVRDLASVGEAATLYAQWENNPYAPSDPAEGAVTVTLRAGETAVFPSLPDGTTYTIAETDIPKGYTLASSSGESGEIAANTASSASFENAYTASGSSAFEARKQLSGRALAAGEFDFQLSADAGFSRIVETAGNDADGNVRFGAVTFDAAGTYTYYIREAAGTDADIVYDDTVYAATVEVADNGDGTLSAGEPAYSVVGGAAAGEALFANSVRTGTLTVTKGLQNATDTAAARAFDFTVGVWAADGSEYAGALAAVVTGADGSVVSTSVIHAGDAVSLRGGDTLVVSGIPYGCTYEVAEADADGFELASSTGAEGVISAAAPDAEAAFTNRYSSYGEAAISVSKVLSGRALAGGQFTFLLLDSEGNEVARAANDADGNVAFPAIGFTEAADGVEHAYTVVERDDGDAGYTYVPTGKRVTVTPADDGHGAMACEPVFDGGDSTFANSYSASGELRLTATKALSGHDLADGQFQFQVKDAAGRVVATGANDADGLVEFGPIAFTEADAGKDVTLYVSEVDDGKPGYTYDARVVPVAVTVADDGNGGRGDGTLSLTLPDDLSVSFANAYAPEGSAQVAFRKVLSGRDLAAGEFAFSLVEVGADGEPLPGAEPLTATNAADGTVAFPALYFGAADAGEHRYVAREAAGSDATITYDDAELAVVVQVSVTGGDELSCSVTYPDGQVFENAYSAPPAPDEPDEPDEPDPPTPPAPEESDLPTPAPDGPDDPVAPDPASPAPNEPVAPGEPATPADPKVRPATATQSGTPKTGDAVPVLAVGALALAALAALALSRRRPVRGAHARK